MRMGSASEDVTGGYWCEREGNGINRNLASSDFQLSVEGGHSSGGRETMLHAARRSLTRRLKTYRTLCVPPRPLAAPRGRGALAGAMAGQGGGGRGAGSNLAFSVRARSVPATGHSTSDPASDHPGPCFGPACAEHVGMQGDDPELRKLSPQLHRMKFLEVLEADARIYLYHHFLTDEECDATKAKALSHLKRSGVVDTGTGGTKLDDVRTSEGMFFQRGQDPMIQAIEKRLSEWTLTAVHAGEGLQVLRYQHDQEYKPCFSTSTTKSTSRDYFFDDKHSRNGENRYATVLMYLEGAEEGGETVPAPHGQNANFSDCAKYNLAVKPKKGDAILFHSMKPGSGKLEDRSMHGACPVIKGEKWSMTKW
eukprot:gene22112-29172_t